MKTIILTLSLCFSSTLFAREVKLATITSNVDTDTSYFNVEVTEEGILDSVHFQTITQSGRISQDSVYPVETVVTDGVVVIHRNGREILRLKSDETFSPKTGGTAKLQYLYSAVSNSWKTLKVNVVKGAEDFEIRTLKGEKVNKFFTKGNFHPILGVIGIAELVPVLQKH